MARLPLAANPVTGLFYVLSPIPVIFILFASCKEKAAVDKSKKQGNQPVTVDVIVASPRSISNQIEANGNVVADEYVELRPEISGRITYLNVPEGAHIKKGTVIARINDADLQATLQKSQAQLDLYQKTEERERKLLEINGINQADYDLALTNVHSTKADIDYTRAQLDKTVIKAPFSGVVGLRQVSPGAYVTPANIIATIQQIDRIKVDFTIPQQYSNVIRKGGLVDIRMEGSNAPTRKALIIATEPQINLSSRNLKVRAILQSGQSNPGAFVKVFVNAGVDKKAIMVPTNALIPDDKNNQIILVKEGKAQFVDVSTGVREANNVEITKGVALGDTVVVTGVLFAKPKAQLKIRSVKSTDQPDSNQ